MEVKTKLNMSKDLKEKRASNIRRLQGLGLAGAIGLMGILSVDNNPIYRNLEIGINSVMLNWDSYSCIRKHGSDSETGMYAQDVLRVSRGGEPKYFANVADVEIATQSPFYEDRCPDVGASYWAVQGARNW